MLQPVVPSRRALPPVALLADASLLKGRYPHVLVIGSPTSIIPALAQLRPHVRGPLAQWRPTVATEPPHPTQGGLIIWDVETLVAEQQRRLLEWMNGRGVNVQIISISERPLFPWVW